MPVTDFSGSGVDVEEGSGVPVEAIGESLHESDLYSGHGGFSFAPVNSFAAGKAGFFSSSCPPDPGDHVMCFRRDHWQERGTVILVEEQVSDGTDGLKAGVESVRVTVLSDSGDEFQAWAIFLAPVNDMEYSSICTSAEFRSSMFQRLYFWPSDGGSDFSCGRITDVQARESLKLWLGNILDADGEALEIPQEIQEELVHAFNEQPDPSINLYSKHMKLGPRLSQSKGSDYSIYYLALNNTLNHDEGFSLECAFPLIRHMIYRLLYTRMGSRKVLHPGGRVWKGDTEVPVPINMKKLKDAWKQRTLVRFRQFQSTTADESVANKFKKGGDKRGYLWTIDIPEDFWGARDIHNVAWKAHETETLFPPYSAFLVEDVSDDCCHLLAVEKFSDCRDLSGLSNLGVDLMATIS